MREKYPIPCVLNGVLEEKMICPDNCSLRPYTLDLQEYLVTVTFGEQGYTLRAQRRDQVERNPLSDIIDTPHDPRSMLKKCVNYPSVITSRQIR